MAISSYSDYLRSRDRDVDVAKFSSFYFDAATVLSASFPLTLTSFLLSPYPSLSVMSMVLYLLKAVAEGGHVKVAVRILSTLAELELENPQYLRSPIPPLFTLIMLLLFLLFQLPPPTDVYFVLRLIAFKLSELGVQWLPLAIDILRRARLMRPVILPLSSSSFFVSVSFSFSLFFILSSLTSFIFMFVRKSHSRTFFSRMPS